MTSLIAIRSTTPIVVVLILAACNPHAADQFSVLCRHSDAAECRQLPVDAAQDRFGDLRVNAGMTVDVALEETPAGTPIDANLCPDNLCVQECAGGATKCGNQCVDMTMDPGHCGACFRACATDEVCSAGTCGIDCFGGTTKCENRCADLNTDPANCGICAKTCGIGEVCSSGTCALLCTGGSTKCGN